MDRLLIILVSIVVVFIVSRLLTYLILIKKTISKKAFLEIKGFRLHHFVYGNFIVFSLAFMVFVLDIRLDYKIESLLFGIGLGLVLDEFPHWVGDTKELNRNVLMIKNGAIAVGIMATILVLMIFLT